MLQALAPRAPDLPGDVDYIAISPNVRLGTLRDTTLWSRANVERWIELGRRDAEKQLPAVIRLFSTRDG